MKFALVESCLVLLICCGAGWADVPELVNKGMVMEMFAPLNWDVFTDIVLLNINGPLFSNFLGKFDADGRADALLYAPSLPAVALGVRLYFAFCCNSFFDLASNSVAIEIVQ